MKTVSNSITLSGNISRISFEFYSTVQYLQYSTVQYREVSAVYKSKLFLSKLRYFVTNVVECFSPTIYFKLKIQIKDRRGLKTGFLDILHLLPRNGN